MKTRFFDRIIDIIEYLMIKNKHPAPAPGTYNTIKTPICIQHAAGEIEGKTYTNTLEALQSNYIAGERFFEIDMMLTSDGHIICIHGWEQMIHFKGGIADNEYCHADFMGMKRKDGLHQLDIEGLAKWMSEHSDTCIITDIKECNIKALEMISSGFLHLVPRIVPQIFRISEYHKVRAMGYQNIILTHYMHKYSDAILIKFATAYPLFAVTLRETRIKRKKLASRLKKIGVPVYAYTVNAISDYEILREKGAFGIYTDFLKTNELLTN